jgi:hypothetical protein
VGALAGARGVNLTVHACIGSKRNALSLTISAGITGEMDRPPQERPWEKKRLVIIDFLGSVLSIGLKGSYYYAF